MIDPEDMKVEAVEPSETDATPSLNRASRRYHQRRQVKRLKAGRKPHRIVQFAVIAGLAPDPEPLIGRRVVVEAQAGPKREPKSVCVGRVTAAWLDVPPGAEHPVTVCEADIGGLGGLLGPVKLRKDGSLLAAGVL